MADHIKTSEPPVSGSIDQDLINSSSHPMALSIIPPEDLHETPDELSEDGEYGAVPNISEEDGESLIGFAMSRAATHLKSPKTPAVEKQSALEDGGGYFESDPETPPATGPTAPGLSFPTPTPLKEVNGRREDSSTRKAAHGRGLSLGELPSSKPEATDLPTPWHSGPKPLIIQRPEPGQSTLSVAFGAGTERKRSLSGGADALRKLLPKGLPSMAQVGSLFGSSTTGHKSRLGPANFSQDSTGFHTGRSAASSNSSGSPPIISLSQRIYQPVPATQPPTGQRDKTIRRVASDESMLYHSLSRTSSLGDDTRFENHRDQVNSRVKAIRDSLQDRSSFRMPNLPSMPSMPRVPNFSFNITFLNANNVPARSKPDTDESSDILSATVTKKKLSPIPNPAVGSGMVGAAVSRPEAAIESAKSIVEGSNTQYLDRAMETLEGDVVIMGGYRGSILRSTKTNRQVWVPVKVGLNIRKVNLEVGLEPEDEERMSETIYASGMLQNIGPVDISKRLFKRLSECENAKNGKLRIWDYGYDWRLSPHLLSKRLTEFLEKLPCNGGGVVNRKGGALVIAHSLGGVITRHVVNHRPELFSGVIYAGVPQSCINILGPIRNGDAVLLSSRVLTAQVNFTLRTSFVLLPEDGSCFVDIKTKKKYPMDFFNLDNWIKYRFSPCTDPPLPPWSQSSGLSHILNIDMGSILNLPIPGKKSISGSSSPPPAASSHTKADVREDESHQSKTSRVADTLQELDHGTDRTLAPQMGNTSNPVSKGHSSNSSVSTAVTIPRDKAIAYLRRTLAETKKFKQELHFRTELSEANRYPPLAVIYGKSIPTCCGAKVDGLASIPHSDVYDNLAFASGDGVCLAKEAMLPEGYKVAFGGRIRSDRGHVTLLGDLNAVGRAIEAVSRGRSKGIGLGTL